MTTDRIALSANVSAIPTERGIEVRGQLNAETEMIVCTISWPDVDHLRAKRPERLASDAD